jgi:hypothetical protein
MESNSRPRDIRLPAGIGLISLASLLLEISLTRLFSVLFYPPAVFAILSLAILGIGLGAGAALLADDLRRAERVPVFLGLGGVSVALIGLVSSIPTLHRALFVLAVLPYFAIGLSLTTLFAGAGEDSPRLYRADLIGAGVGAALAIPLLNLLGGLNGALAGGVLLAAAGLMLPVYSTSRYGLALTGAAVIVFAGNVMTGWLAVPIHDLSIGKPIQESLAGEGSRIVRTEWDAFARSDLIDPGDGGPYRLYMDGAAGSIMPPAQDNEFLWEDIGLFPFVTQQPERVFIVGPGGGLDVWFALQGNASEVVAVEVSPTSVALVRDYAAYNGDLYAQPGVQVIVDEGRSVLRRDERQYDLIFLSQVVTLAAERSGYALVENTTYTVEAFGEYLDHLRPSGQLAIKLYDEPTLTRALSTALAAFNRQGLTDQEALNHVVVLLDRRAQPPVPLLLVGKSAFTQQESLAIGQIAQQVDFTPLLLPGLVAPAPLDGVASGTVTFDEIVEPMPEDFSPTTDDRPFFYQFERGVPRSLQPLLWGTVGVLAVGSVLLTVRPWGMAAGRWRWSPLYFAALGLGFIMIEIGVIQQTRLFLGHPTLAITTALAALLVGGGIGSGLAGQFWPGNDRTLPAWPALGVILMLGLWALVWPLLSEGLTAAGPALRVLATAASLLPLSLFMGMPFPLGLRTAARMGNRQVAGAWMVNGVTSVAGSILATVLAILAGFTIVLAAGGLMYAAAAGITLLLQDENENHDAANQLETPA